MVLKSFHYNQCLSLDLEPGGLELVIVKFFFLLTTFMIGESLLLSNPFFLLKVIEVAVLKSANSIVYAYFDELEKEKKFTIFFSNEGMLMRIPCWARRPNDFCQII